MRSNKLLLSLLFIGLVGCSKNTQQGWQLTKQGLSYNQQAINIESEKIPQCDECIIAKNSQHSPNGPITTYAIKHNNLQVAGAGITQDSSVFIPNNQGATRLPLRNEEGKWLLDVQGNKILLQEGQVSKVTIYNQQYMLFLEAIDGQKIKYTWLKS